jgi:catechol 2,3-dioxygenase-like lactoylglutathione lyase family enzyme
MGLRWHGTSIDAIDPARLARWWAEVLGVRVVYEKPDVVALPGLVFVRCSAPKAGTGRLHLDLTCDDVTADLERLMDMGARHVGPNPARVSSIVLADPEGNEFCVLTLD